MWYPKKIPPLYFLDRCFQIGILLNLVYHSRVLCPTKEKLYAYDDNTILPACP